LASWHSPQLTTIILGMCNSKLSNCKLEIIGLHTAIREDCSVLEGAQAQIISIITWHLASVSQKSTNIHSTQIMESHLEVGDILDLISLIQIL
jgi:hypothetical protein